MATAKKNNVRRDPRRRHHDGAKTVSLEGPAELLRGRKYIYVYRADPVQGPEFYEDAGFQYASAQEGVRARGGKTRGDGKDTVEYRGHVLMWCTAQRWLEIQQRGIDGETGQELADAVEDAILDKSKGGTDALRGIRGDFLRVENDTERLSEFSAPG